MRIINFNLEKIEAEKKKNLKGKLEIKSNLEIDDIEKEKVDIVGEILRLSFTYSIKYEPGFANMVFKGAISIIPDNEESIKKILKEWKKKKIENELRIPIFNFIISKCNLRALQLEEELALPPHIPLPALSREAEQQNRGTKQTNYTG